MGIKLQDNLGNDLLSDQSGFVGQNLIDNSGDVLPPAGNPFSPRLSYFIHASILFVFMVVPL